MSDLVWLILRANLVLAAAWAFANIKTSRSVVIVHVLQ